MSVLDLECWESVYYYQNYCINGSDKLYLGKYGINNYLVYIYFRLPPFLFNEKVKETRLVLFKVPVSNYEQCQIGNMKKAQYCVSPLLVFFSTIGCCHLENKIDYGKSVYYEDFAYSTYNEIDITVIMQAWIREKIENKGLLLAGIDGAGVISYGSDSYEIKVMRPLIRITYEDNHIIQPMKEVPCIVEVL